jgi:hypothetical protein
LFKSYDKFSEGFSKLTFASPFLSFLFGGVCLIFSTSFFIDINKEYPAGSIFRMFQFFFEPPISNIINGSITLLLAIFLIWNGVNKKWPKIKQD